QSYLRNNERNIRLLHIPDLPAAPIVGSPEVLQPQLNLSAYAPIVTFARQPSPLNAPLKLPKDSYTASILITIISTGVPNLALGTQAIEKAQKINLHDQS